MIPAPSRTHQAIVGELHLQVGNHLRGKSCKVYTSPFDVRLPAPGESDESPSTVVKPDLVVVCNPGKLDDRGGKGAPDLVMVFRLGADAAYGRPANYTLGDRIAFGVLPELEADLFAYADYRQIAAAKTMGLQTRLV